MSEEKPKRGILFVPRYYWKIIKTSLKTTLDGFVPKKASLVKSVVTTAVFWLILVKAGLPIIGKVKESVAFALAIIGVFVFMLCSN